MLEIKDLHVQFHTSDHEAVRGIDLTVQDGEIMGLVGESGSGKTVTAMMVSGLLRPELALAWYFDLPHADAAQLAKIRKELMPQTAQAAPVTNEKKKGETQIGA